VATVTRTRQTLDVSREQLIAEARALRVQGKALRERCGIAVEYSRRLAEDFQFRLLLDETQREKWLTSLAARLLAAFRSSKEKPPISRPTPPGDATD
jgi:hypothetical protein